MDGEQMMGMYRKDFGGITGYVLSENGQQSVVLAILTGTDQATGVDLSVAEAKSFTKFLAKILDEVSEFLKWEDEVPIVTAHGDIRVEIDPKKVLDAKVTFKNSTSVIVDIREISSLQSFLYRYCVVPSIVG